MQLWSGEGSCEGGYVGVSREEERRGREWDERKSIRMGQGKDSIQERWNIK